MTKFLDKSFSSRPSSREYRDNYDRTFKKKRETVHAFITGAGDVTCRCVTCGEGQDHPLHSAIESNGDTPAPEGQIWVCGACGKTSTTRYGFKDSSCMSNAVLCYDREQNGRQAVWEAVDKAEASQRSNVIESTTAVQINKPEHEAGCNCRLCRTARRAEGK